MSLSQEQLQSHLDRVSRSFAACIAQLDQPLRRYVSLTYLLCRVIDTVEDARWTRLNQQLQAFDFLNLVVDAPEAMELINSADLAAQAGVTAGEADLIKVSKSLFKELHQLPGAVKYTIGALVKTMAKGMAYFVKRKRDGIFRIQNLREVNQYCFFVAGIVGETLANLLSAVDPRMGVNPEQIRNAHHFGLFLQKINVLKDQYKDESEGRFLVPSRREVLESMQANIEGGWRYIDAVSDEHRSYRVFCLWSFFLALKTLPLLVTQKEGELEPKISRESANTLFADLQARANDRSYLKNLLDELCLGLPRPQDQVIDVPAKLIEDKEWFNKIYQGPLSSADLKKLGLFAG